MSLVYPAQTEYVAFEYFFHLIFDSALSNGKECIFRYITTIPSFIEVFHVNGGKFAETGRKSNFCLSPPLTEETIKWLLTR